MTSSLVPRAGGLGTEAESLRGWRPANVSPTPGPLLVQSAAAWTEPTARRPSPEEANTDSQATKAIFEAAELRADPGLTLLLATPDQESPTETACTGSAMTVRGE